MERGVIIRWIIIILVIILLLLAPLVYFTYFYYKSCDSYECFRSHLAKCTRTQYLLDSNDATWSYKINGQVNGQCKVYTQLKQIKQGNIEISATLENKDMYCYLPYGVVASPESDISKCHGELKEAMQEVIIQRLHSYILGNIGNITQELEKVL